MDKYHLSQDQRQIIPVYKESWEFKTYHLSLTNQPH